MDRKKTIIISITGIIITILALLGFTYGYYLTAIRGNENSKSVELITGISSVLFTDLSESNISEIIEPGYEMTKSFTVENTGEITATYSIYFVDVYNDFVRTEDVRYKLYRIDNNSEFPDNYEGCVTNPTDEKQCKIIVEDEEFPTEGESLIQANEQIPITGDTYRYDLVITYINQPTINQNADQGHIFRGKINLMGDVTGPTDTFKKGTLAYSILNNAKNNRNGTIFVETPPSKVAEETAQADERVLSTTEDDLGTGISYYFRGDVTDNYVNFAGMCWRIVRIQGDGSIKLILEDQYATCDDEKYTGNWSLGYSEYGSSIVGGSDEEGYSFEPNYFDNYYGMIKNLQNFQTQKLNNYLSSLKSGDWCLADNVRYSYHYTSGYTINENGTFFDSIVRLEGYNNEYLPTLKCTGRILTEFSDKTPMYVGALTADEVAFAGSKYNYETDAVTLYLNNDYFYEEINKGIEFDEMIIYAQGFWLSTPKSTSSAFVYGLNGLFTEENITAYIGGGYPADALVRPALILTSDINLKDGTGLQEDPYVIE